MDPHSDGAALMRAAHARPNDDTPHLVFADWAEDNGMPHTAACIRHVIDARRSPNNPDTKARLTYKWEGGQDAGPGIVVHHPYPGGESPTNHRIRLIVNHPDTDNERAISYEHTFTDGKTDRSTTRGLVSEGFSPGNPTAVRIASVPHDYDEPQAGHR